MKTGLTTVVTGASSGIGRSLALGLAAAGHPVALLARRRSLLESLAGEIETRGGRALPVVCDVTDAEQVQSAFQAVATAWGPVERLVANAGGGAGTDARHFEAASLAASLELNVLSTARCIEAVLPGMLERGQGHLVAMGSLAAYRGLPGGAAYSASKAALTNLMESLRVDLRPHGIDVTLLLPGFVRVKQRKSGRRKPLELSLADATARMQRSIEARRPRDAFPLPLVIALSLLRLAPAGWADRLLGRVV